MTMQAGKLRHRITLQRNVPRQDPHSGEMVSQWHDVDSVWAEVVPLSAREFVAARAVQSEVVARITIRYRADVDSTMRVIHRGEIYAIDGVLADACSNIKYVTLIVRKGAADE